MMKILHFIAYGCWPNFKATGKTVSVYWNGPDTYMGYKEIVRCEKCGRTHMTSMK